MINILGGTASTRGVVRGGGEEKGRGSSFDGQACECSLQRSLPHRAGFCVSIP